MYRKTMIAGLVLTSLIAAACGDDSGETPTDTVDRSQTTAGNGRSNEPGNTTTD